MKIIIALVLMVGICATAFGATWENGTVISQTSDSSVMVNDGSGNGKVVSW